MHFLQKDCNLYYILSKNELDLQYNNKFLAYGELFYFFSILSQTQYLG
ncbi:hypothetical protein SAMN05421785_102414 [Chryseobacterium gambrini]|uniref:Uncharacterized protein n=1 Tax=Chryseobacterium gambrini TaxID=373672 RepID=A0A1N7LQ25_9FLAO|nr:hypothetical protein SAMN05421785_102414 [Chryseobacterium gambrini]